MIKKTYCQVICNTSNLCCGGVAIMDMHSICCCEFDTGSR